MSFLYRYGTYGVKDEVYICLASVLYTLSSSDVKMIRSHFKQSFEKKTGLRRNHNFHDIINGNGGRYAFAAETPSYHHHLEEMGGPSRF